MKIEAVKILAGVLLIIVGIAICFHAAWNNGQDFSYLYVLGRLISEGKNPYVPANAAQAFLMHYGSIPNEGYATIFYPPSAGLMILPLALLPFRIAWTIWLLLSLLLLPLALWQLLKIVTPGLSLGNRLLLMGVVQCCGGLRWSVLLLQLSALITALAVFFINDMLTGRTSRAALWATVALCLKFTLALPFIGILLACRKFKSVGIACAVCGVLMLVGFLLVGGRTAYTTYTEGMKTVETAAQAINSPDPYVFRAVSRLDFTFLVCFVRRDITFAHVADKVLTLISVLVLLWQGVRASALKECSSIVVLFYPPLACLSLLGIYHHHYDSVLLVPAFLLLFHPVFAPSRRLLLCSGLPLLFYLTFYPQGRAQVIFVSFGGHTGDALAKTIGSMAIVLFFIGSLVAIHRSLNVKIVASIEGEIAIAG